MVRPSVERSTFALTDVQSLEVGDGTDVGGDDVDFDGGGTGGGGGTVVTPPATEPVETVADAGDAVDINLDTARWWDITLTEDCVLEVSGAPASGMLGELNIILRQGTGAPWVVTWDSVVTWPDTDGTEGGSAPTLHTVEDALDVITLRTIDGGTTWGGSYDSAGAGGNGNDTSLEEVASSGAAQTVEVDVARTWDITLDDDCAIDLSGAVTGEAWFATVILRQGIGAPYLVTWDGAITWQGGIAPILGTVLGDWDVVTFLSVDGGTNWLGVAGDSSVNAHITDPTAAHAASAVSYSNGTSGLAATDTQAAIDEVVTMIGVTGGEDTSLVIVTSTGTTETLDIIAARTYDVQLDDNCTFTLTSPGSLEAHQMRIILRQDSVGTRLATWPASVFWIGGSAPTLATSPFDANIIRLVTTSGGSEWLGESVGAIALTAYPFASSGTGGSFPLVFLNLDL